MVGISTDLCSARLGSMGIQVIQDLGCSALCSSRGCRHDTNSPSKAKQAAVPHPRLVPAVCFQYKAARRDALSALVCREAGPGQLLLGWEEGLERWLILQLLQG